MCVCEAIVQVLRQNPIAKVLVCAPSDAACDVLASRLLPLLPKTNVQPPTGRRMLLRINWWSRKLASLDPSLLTSCSMDPVGAVFTLPTLTEFQAASIVVCQCFVAEWLEFCGKRGWTKKHFTHLFIDETSQAMECESLVPIFKVN